jgi:predicted house-cleaning NTP pyrophosphatase (Maf/HAM1 superfamily)
MVANVREYFRQEYTHVYFDDISDSFIEEYLSRPYVVSLSFKMQMDCLYDTVMSQAMVDYDE